MSSVRPSVMLMDCDDIICWNSLNIISWLVILLCSLFAYPNIMGLRQGEHPQILDGIGVGYEKEAFAVTLAFTYLL